MPDEKVTISGKAEIDGLPDEVKNLPITPLHGMSGIALAMAMKYHDIGTVQDGTLYQQYKLEGKNLQPLHIDMVLETAEKLERWLLGSSDRFAAFILAAEILPDEPDGSDGPIAPEQSEQE